jgi:hypothetical protein
MKLLTSLALGLVLVSAPSFADDSANTSAMMSDHVLGRDSRAATREGILTWRADPTTRAPAVAARRFAAEPQVSQTAATEDRAS